MGLSPKGDTKGIVQIIYTEKRWIDSLKESLKKRGFDEGHVRKNGA